MGNDYAFLNDPVNKYDLTGHAWDWGVALDVLGVVSTLAMCVPGLQVVCGG